MDIKAFREMNNLTQKELAELIGIPASTLSHIENGRTKNSKYIKRIQEYMLKNNQYFITSKKYRDVEKQFELYNYTKSIIMDDIVNSEEVKNESWFSKIFKFIGVK